MEELFTKFCRYYVLNGSEDDLKILKEEAKEKFREYQKKALKFAKNIRHKTQKLGYNTDFESFCNMLEDYINKKDNLNDDEKKFYLKILVSLSEVHEINLREELERYVSYKETPINEETLKEIFKKFCLYNLNPNNNVEAFNELQTIASSNNLDFYELQQKSISFTEEINELTNLLGFNTDEESFYQMVSYYNKEKKNMTDKQKASYLRILLYLSEIYNVNLRELLTKKDNNSNEKELDVISIISNMSNPLDNKELLSTMLDQRYHNGQFDIEHIYDGYLNDEETFDFYKIHANLTYKLYRIFIDKMSNYAYDDLNSKYSNLISEEELVELDNLKEESIYNILKEIDKNETKHYICKKYRITENLYNFISLSSKEATNIKNDIVDNSYSLFNNKYTQSTIAIHLKGTLKSNFELLNDYITSCIQNNLNYNINSPYNSDSNTCIIYASKDDITKKIKILNKLILKHNHHFSKPNPICGRINDLCYGITDIGILKDDLTCIIPYYEYINIISEIAYYRVLAKLVISKIDDEKARYIVNGFITLNDLECINNEKFDININNFDFATIKDLINQYVPLVINTLAIYMEDIEQKDNLIKEFRKSLMYLHNLILNSPKKENSNLAISQFIKNGMS